MSLKASERMKLTTAFDKVAKLALEGATETVTGICEEVYYYADARVPVLTGNLQASAMYNVQSSNTDVQGEVHFGEPGHVGGWKNEDGTGNEAYTYMWEPGLKESNYDGKILYDGWDKIKDRIVPEMKENIASKFKE